ncbi:hypothetical protein [Streptomyces sp. NPDC058657]|uniref:hypothetical protein n=1 Tax=unclassified Streptomyces TaxID=2593676 RepID=UPI0036609F13
MIEPRRSVATITDRELARLYLRIEALERAVGEVATEAAAHRFCLMRQNTVIQRAEHAEAALARIGQMVDAWERRLPETVRTATVIEAIRHALGRNAYSRAGAVLAALDDVDWRGPVRDELAPMFEGFERLLTTSSRDWGEYWVDAWLYAVLVGWDCEDAEHNRTCVHGALEEMAARHGWDDETVAKVRRYRSAVRAVVEAGQGGSNTSGGEG